MYAAPTADENTAAISFAGAQPQGTSSAQRPLTLTNHGSASLIVSGVILAGTDPSDYLVEDGCQQPVAPDDGCTIEVRFDPQAAGASSATLTLLTNAPTAPAVVALSGTGATASSSTATVVRDAASNKPWSGTEKTGASAYDTAAVTRKNGVAPTGKVTYRFFKNGSCSGTAATTQRVTLAGGNVPHSHSTGHLVAGSYSYRAAYSGDPSYAGSSSACERFTVH
jgi:hypothetical protein